MQDEEYIRVLAAHGADSVSRCFILRNWRTDRYSVGWFDENNRPFILMDDDEEFHQNLVQFLRRKDVRVFENVSELNQ